MEATLEHADLQRRDGQAGFTLVEALIAIFILIVGVAAVATLMVVAGTSNTAANHGTAATAVATQQLELLKATPYGNLVPQANTLAAPGVGPIAPCGPVVGTYRCFVEVQGVGRMNVRWQIDALPAAPTSRFIQVVAESSAPSVALRSRAWFTTVRTQ
jgi:type II secretory pathway pseudopilin PulG